jgi:RNA-dependent RNA polymerase
MGDFSHNRVVAKYAARLGLCFSTTRAINSIGRAHIRTIEDIEKDGYCFTDGVGKISSFVAQMIAQELKLSPALSMPSAFQFRMGGCKGMLVAWPDIKGPEIQLRKSQIKFQTVYSGLEIIRCSHFSTASLNRQTVTILSSLGVEDEIFNHMLNEQVSNYLCAMTDEKRALNLLSRYVDDNYMTVVIAKIISDGFMQTREPFLLSILHLWRSWSIKALKEKARIIVEKGAFLLGCVDEVGVLRGHKKVTGQAGCPADVDELPEIFIQVPERDLEGKITNRYVVIEGVCVLGRNPSLHPGDIRVVKAINAPELHHLRDVVVFPQVGERDIPSMCSGGDLDGDDFFVIWDEDLIPTEWNATPMDYSPPKAKELTRPVEVQDMMKFFVRYMKNDSLPTIAHAHLALSDFLDLGVKDPRCKQNTLSVCHNH